MKEYMIMNGKPVSTSANVKLGDGLKPWSPKATSVKLGDGLKPWSPKATKVKLGDGLKPW
jgi:hypothetical protein